MPRRYEDLIRMGIRKRKMTLYEVLCGFSEKLIKFKIPVYREKDVQNAINFCHLNITPKGSFLFSIFFTIFILFFITFLSIFGILNTKLAIFLYLVTLYLGYYFLNYPFHYLTAYKINASSEMVLAILYMTVSMKVKSNLENAVVFTASSLQGPLGDDLNELIWDVFNGKYYSYENALDAFIEKWKIDNQDFTQAINLVKTSIYQSNEQRDKVLSEAVRIVLDGTKNSMKRYSRELKSSLSILNTLGILLPIIGMVFFPIVAIFMPEAFKPIAIVVGYDIFLPLAVFFLVKSTLRKRPPTFHQPTIIQKPRVGFVKYLRLDIILPILVVVLLSGFGLYKVLSSTERFSFPNLIFSMLVLGGISIGISLHCFISTIPTLKTKNEIIQMESELHMILFQLGYQLKGGGSIENNIAKIKSKIQELKISRLFGLIIGNIQMFGMNFHNAVFNERNGAIHNYPSKLINAIFKAISEISSSGSAALSDSIISISNYLKNMTEVEEYLEDTLSEVTSTMRLQAFLLAPLASGVVVALAAMMMHMIVSFGGWAESFQEKLLEYGPVGSLGGGVLNSVLEIDKIMPISHFQLIVGFYMLEISAMISIFLSIVEFGDEIIQRKYNLGKTLLIAIGIYSLTILSLYLLITSMLPVLWKI